MANMASLIYKFNSAFSATLSPETYFAQCKYYAKFKS